MGLGKEHHIEVERIVKFLGKLSTCFEDVPWDQNVDKRKLQHVVLP